ncbi:unnamed protein product, partial [Heterotrigona itama]
MESMMPNWSRVQNQTSTNFRSCVTLAGFFHSRCS